jgi:hypothetical protein
MFCTKCGKENQELATFCASCGIALNFDAPQTEVDYFSYYGKDWQRKGVMGFSAMPYHDIAVTDKNLYIIELPKYSWSTWGTVIGLILFILDWSFRFLSSVCFVVVVRFCLFCLCIVFVFFCLFD